MTTSKTITWKCGRCGEKGQMANLDASIPEIRAAVTRAHERRDIDCHDAFGIKHVAIAMNGQTIRFERAPRDDGPETVAGREVSRR